MMQTLPADLHTQPSGHFAHRRQQRQRAGPVFYRLVRDAQHLLLQKRVRQLLQRSQVQVREQRQAFAEVPILLLDRLLHLHDGIRQPPHLRGGANDFRPHRLIFIVREARKLARILLDKHLVSRIGKGFHAGRRNADAALVVFHFLGDADDHGNQLLR
jgi:hypothetical protein